ncbi:hypothetical protein QN222_02990 [Sinorhizobium sp. 6-70]|nr:hypothetical protein [Sinorhizobium sp. 6-70]MDK1373442.1 hypothetical protein [Sinorhizobium sp. 6-70]
MSKDLGALVTGTGMRRALFGYLPLNWLDEVTGFSPCSVILGLDPRI